MFYLFLLLGLCGIAFVKSKIKEKKVFDILILLIMTIVYGFRYRVGIDYKNYEAHYYNISGFYGEKEYLFELMINAFRYFEFPFWVFSAFIGFCIFYLLYLICRELDIGYEKVIIIFIFSGMLFVSFNLIRQILAGVIVIYAFKYLTKNDFKKYMLCVVSAGLIHTTAFIFIPFYFTKNIKLNAKKCIILIIIGVVLYYSNILTIIERYAIPEQYSSYIGGVFDYNVNPGFGVLFYITIVIILGFYMVNNHNKLYPYYTTYIFGYSLLLFTLNSFIFNRILEYSQLAVVIVLSYLLRMPKRNEDIMNILNVVIILVYGLMFLNSIINIYDTDSNKLLYKTIFNKE